MQESDDEHLAENAGNDAVEKNTDIVEASVELPAGVRTYPVSNDSESVNECSQPCIGLTHDEVDHAYIDNILHPGQPVVHRTPWKRHPLSRTRIVCLFRKRVRVIYTTTSIEVSF